MRIADIVVVLRNPAACGGVDTVLDELAGGTISTDDDAALVGRARAGDTDAYAVLVRRHAPMAMRTAALLGAGANTEDVVQEALVKAYRSLGRFREDRPFRPWLLRIVANEAHNAHRSAVRRSAREQRGSRTCRSSCSTPQPRSSTVRPRSSSSRRSDACPTSCAPS